MLLYIIIFKQNILLTFSCLSAVFCGGLGGCLCWLVQAGNNKHGLSTLSSKTGEVLDSIASHARETEQALIQRISERKTDADKYRSTVAVAVGKFRGAVTGQLDTLRSHASSLEDSMESWVRTCGAVGCAHHSQRTCLHRP